MNMKALLSSGLVIAGLAAAAPSFAVEAARNTMESKMSVPQTCRVTANQDVDYGAYTGTRVRKTMTVSARCNKFESAQVISFRFDCGKNGAVAGTVCSRNMKNTNESITENNLLQYKIFNDSSYTAELPNTGRNIAYNGAGSVTTQTFYPELLASQFTSVYGSYADDVTITIAF